MIRRISEFTLKKIKGPMLIFFAIGFLVIVNAQESFASTGSYPVLTGANTLFYRDTTSIDPTPPATISLNPTKFLLGDNVTITISDFNANLKTDTIDSISVNVGSQTVVASETGTSTATFAGSFIGGIGKQEIGYTPDPAEVSRATVNLDLASDGNVILSDVILDQTTIDNLCFIPVTYPLNVDLANGASLTLGTSIVVTLSFANGAFLPTDDFSLLQMYYKEPGQNFEVVTASFDVDSRDFGTLTVTSDPVEAGFAGDVTTGQFVLGFETGCGGGGGGGIIHPGLVLNVLAGSLRGSSKDVSPPTLVFEQQSTTGLKFADKLFGVQPDPLKPIDPSENPEAPLKINGQNFDLIGYANTVKPTTALPGDPFTMSLTFLDQSSVPHIALHFVDDTKDEMSDTDTTITFDSGNTIVSNPEGILGDDVQISESSDGTKKMFNFVFSFTEPTNRHLMITVWDEYKNSANVKVFDAFQINPAPLPEGEAHMIPFESLVEYFISPQPTERFVYLDSLGRLDRHETLGLDDAIKAEQEKATAIMLNDFGLDSKTFQNEETKPSDTRRANQLNSCGSGVGCDLDGKEKQTMKKELCWEEHLKAEKKLNSQMQKSKLS